MARTSGAVLVLADLAHFAEPRLMGTLRRQMGRGADVFSFEYDRGWLGSKEGMQFDPDLALVEGPQYPPARRENFGIFLDSAPDRWGRLLIERREGLVARHEGRRPRALTEWDFLLGVHDEVRMGALRFRDPETGRWADSSEMLAAPPIASLGELQEASLRFEASDGTGNEAERWFAQLFAPGSSLGGARPKASVRDEDGGLCIAKFPSRQDRRDVGAWELLAYRLAVKAGIRVPAARGIRVPGSPYTTFLTRRFDRTEEGRRLAFVSALTLTQRSDGEAGGSYLELVDLLQSQGAQTKADCGELFRRVVFSILIHNTDDHLRNHGFFLTDRGVVLSPAYDMNPSVDRDELTLAINEVDAGCDVEIALESHRAYGLKAAEAKAVIAEVGRAVETWSKEASRLRIPKMEQEMMAAAFEPRIQPAMSGPF